MVVKIRLIDRNDIKRIVFINNIVWFDTYINEKYGILYKNIEKLLYSKNYINIFLKKIHFCINNKYGLVLEVNNNILGYILFIFIKNKCFILNLYILIGYQRNGYGNMLLEKVINICNKFKKELYLDVVLYNKNAIKFYKKNGFIILPNYKKKYFISDNKFIVIIRMFKKV